MTMAPDLDELERLARRATPGPWDTYSSGSSRDYRPGVSARDSIVAAEVWDTDEHENADYIAAVSPEVVLSLIKAKRRAGLRTKALRDDKRRVSMYLRVEREAAKKNLARAERAEAAIAAAVKPLRAMVDTYREIVMDTTEDRERHRRVTAAADRAICALDRYGRAKPEQGRPTADDDVEELRGFLERDEGEQGASWARDVVRRVLAENEALKSNRPTRAQITKALMIAAAEQGPHTDGELDLTPFVEAVWALLDGEPA